MAYNGKWLIWSHEHRAFWPENCCGYVAIEEAGRFDLEEAVTIVNEANLGMCDGKPEETMMPADHPRVSLKKFSRTDYTDDAARDDQEREHAALNRDPT